MRVLIVEKNQDLGRIWKHHLSRHAAHVTLVSNQAEAIDVIRDHDVQVIILNVMLPGESAFGVADYASYRSPKAKVIFVTDTTFFSDGSIFEYTANACACVGVSVPPDDLCAMVEHYGMQD